MFILTIIQNIKNSIINWVISSCSDKTPAISNEKHNNIRFKYNKFILFIPF